MIIKIVFSKSRSENYAAAVGRCKRFPTYRTWLQDGVPWHSVEISDWESWVSIQQMVGAWKTTMNFFNGELINFYDIWDKYEKQKSEKERLQKIANARIFADAAPKESISHKETQYRNN